jgi:endonuclease YncB( thermonuclease family)
MSQIRIVFNLALILLSLAIYATALAEDEPSVDESPLESVEGRVIKIIDGNTLTVMLPESRQLKVRMAEIDAPEKNQAHYREAKQALTDKAFTEDVRIEIVSRENSSTVIGNVILDGEYLNYWMVAEGHAWVYPEDTDNQELLEMEANAEIGYRGFWALSDTERVPPWEWRQGKRIGTRTRAVPARAYTCGSKTRCDEMTSCDEARFYLNQCYLVRLDDNNDGIPCESLCGDFR